MRIKKESNKGSAIHSKTWKKPVESERKDENKYF